MKPGTLYLVATPLGNLGDITYRAVETLKAVALIAAEDTRRTHVLCQKYGIATPLTSLHEHNEGKKAPELPHRTDGNFTFIKIWGLWETFFIRTRSGNCRAIWRSVTFVIPPPVPPMLPMRSLTWLISPEVRWQLRTTGIW